MTAFQTGFENKNATPWSSSQMWPSMHYPGAWTAAASGAYAAAMQHYPYNYDSLWENFGPPLAVRVEGLNFHYQLTDDDVLKVFSRYGPVASVDVRQGGNLAYIQFMSVHNACQAIQDLDGKTLAGPKGGRLRVAFQSPTGGAASQGSNRWSNSWSWPGANDNSPNAANRKFTCKVEFDIENDKEFRVSSKVIAVARRIWQELPHFQQRGGKTRLRGKGSGFLEGPDQKEADEPLHLCISCREHNSFEEAINMAVKEIHNIQRDFVAFRKSKGVPVPKHLGCRVERQTRGIGPDGEEEEITEKSDGWKRPQRKRPTRKGPSAKQKREGTAKRRGGRSAKSKKPQEIPTDMIPTDMIT